MIREGEGAFRRIMNGLPHVAIVNVQIEMGLSEPYIVEKCSGAGWVGQGYLEEVSAVGYDHWKAGAIAGAQFALRVISLTNVGVVIIRITGMDTDTNPTIVGAACANAVWKALDYHPVDEVTQSLEASVRASWNQPHDAIPDFK